MRTRGIPGSFGARFALFVSSFCLPPGAAIAADPGRNPDEQIGQTDVEEIVVVAHKHARARRDVAATVSTFASDDMRFELAASVADVFRYAPGIDYEAAGARFGSESINIRGISGNRVAILVDGVPISDQFDVGSFSNATRDLVSAGFVDHVEVLHGPASALYGSSAIGGVVAMRTVDPTLRTGQPGQGGRFGAIRRPAGHVGCHSGCNLGNRGERQGRLSGFCADCCLIPTLCCGKQRRQTSSATHTGLGDGTCASSNRAAGMRWRKLGEQ